LQARTTEETDIKLTTNIHDTWRGGKKKNGEAEEAEKDKWRNMEEGEDGEEEKEEEGKKARDPLAVLLQMTGDKPLTREIALQIKVSLRSLSPLPSLSL